jgi:hypothetical protein
MEAEINDSPNLLVYIQHRDEYRKLQKNSPEEFLASGKWETPLILLLISEICKAAAFLGSEGLVGTYQVDIQKGVLSLNLTDMERSVGHTWYKREKRWKVSACGRGEAQRRDGPIRN